MSVFIGEKGKRVELAERKDATNPNLFSNTASFKGFIVANTTTAVSPIKDKLDPLGHVTSLATSTWQQAVQFLDIDTSSAYTLSAFIWLNGDQTIKAICRNSVGSGACSNNGTVINGIKSNCWQRISFTFQGFSESHVAFDFEVTDGTVDFWLGSYKLEKGPVATDWCPALEDYAWTSDITNLQNQIQAQQTKLSDDVYTKTEVDGKLTTVGTVKTVDNIQPDSSGNVDLRPEFNSLLGRNNLLTDDEMDISKATKNDPAQQAISNAKYANGVNTFHYCGVTDYEMFNWKIAVQPNTNYEFIIVANSTNQLTALAATEPYIPITVDSSGAFADTTTASNGDLGKGQLALPWQGVETEKITFNSQNHSNIYLAYDFGFAMDGINTDITLQTTLLKADSIQSQIDNLQNQTSTKANSSDVSALQNTVNNIDSTRTPVVAGSAGDDLFAFKTNQIRLYDGNGATCKNLPPASNIHYFTVQYVFEGPTSDGIAIYRSPDNEIWTAGCHGGSYDHSWVRVANSTDVSNLQSMITGLSTKVDSTVAKLQGQITEIQSKNYIEGYNCANESDAETYSKAHPTTLVTVS